MIKFLPSLLTLFCFVFLSHAQELDTNLWITNGTVNAIAQAGKHVFIGGTFTYVGPKNGGGAMIDSKSGLAYDKSPNISGAVFASIPDGKGGWFIGGQFTMFENQNIRNFAHINPDGSLDEAWNLAIDSTIFALIISNDILYIGGDFPSINGQTRRNLTAIDLNSKKLQNWPSDAPSAIVDAITVAGNTVYIGGRFTKVGSEDRKNLASIDKTSGQVTLWNPSQYNRLTVTSTAFVRDLITIGNIIYVGGSLVNNANETKGLLAFDRETGGIVWDPLIEDAVYSMVLSNNVLYIGGSFRKVLGQVRIGLAALNHTTYSLTSWNPTINSNSSVTTLAISGNEVYAAGLFTHIGNTRREYLAAIDASTGLVTSTEYAVYIRNTGIHTLAVWGNSIYVGGYCNSIGGSKREKLAAIDLLTGKASLLAVSIKHILSDAHVQVLKLIGNTLYMGGRFTQIEGQEKRNLAAIDITTNRVLEWNPMVSNSEGYEEVFTLVASADILYVGGKFTRLMISLGKTLRLLTFLQEKCWPGTL